MKKILANVLSGFFGGILIVAAFLVYQQSQNTKERSINLNPFAQPVNENSSPTVGPDFSAAADKALQVVVQINAQESDQLVKQKQDQLNKQYRDPFQDHPFFREFDLRGFGFGTPYYNQKKGSGSGVIVSQDGYIVTNNHVVEFADDIEVILKDERKFKAKKIGTDPRTDLAVLKIESTGLPILETANSDQIKIGEWVLAVGNPFGYLTSTVTAGIVSAKGRDLNMQLPQEDDSQYFNPYGSNSQNPSTQMIEEFIQTDAAVNPGNSGGALVDSYGRLVGINSAIASKTGYYSGYSFAIPINLVNKITKELISTGNFERGRLGVSVSNLDEEKKKELNLSFSEGVVIETMEDNSSAKYAGLLPNDVITKINGKSIKNYDDLLKVVGLTKVGETLNVTIVRDGVTKEVPVRIRKGI
ncbi:MAG TPA: trypsin-like peptidase domain-containing protein [Saprospiraceae bacterium]|nr:trypsin-like peptidase domain-containing protein [Saprospiraceae bacterium]